MSSGRSRRARRRPAGLSARYRPAGNAPLGLGRAGRAFVVRQDDGEAQDTFLAPAQQREHAVRRHGLQPLAGAEIVGELDALGFLAGHDRRAPLAALPHELSKPADELGIL